MLRELQSLLILLAVATPACFAQATSSTAVTGDQRHTSSYTGTGPQGMGGLVSAMTSANSAAFLPTGFGQLSPGGLPKTTLDSFVKNASGNADQIYGDEGADGLPPFENFTAQHRIIAGIRSGGLTTYHGSELPDAWGGDEFIGAEWSNSGPSGGGVQNYGGSTPNFGIPNPALAAAPGNGTGSGGMQMPPPGAQFPTPGSQLPGGVEVPGFSFGEPGF